MLLGTNYNFHWNASLHEHQQGQREHPDGGGRRVPLQWQQVCGCVPRGQGSERAEDVQ